jgi:hypothetical protein
MEKCSSEFEPEGKHIVSGNNFLFLFLRSSEAAMGGGGVQRPFGVSVSPNRWVRAVSKKKIFEEWTNHFVNLFWPFCKIMFFVELYSVLSFVIGSSAGLGMPRNKHFIPWNNGNRSETIPRNFSERNSVPIPTHIFYKHKLCRT